MELLERSLKGERCLVKVGVCDRRASVHADVEGLGCCEGTGNGALDGTCGGLLAIDPELELRGGWTLHVRLHLEGDLHLPGR